MERKYNPHSNNPFGRNPSSLEGSDALFKGQNNFKKTGSGTGSGSAQGGYLGSVGYDLQNDVLNGLKSPESIENNPFESSYKIGNRIKKNNGRIDANGEWEWDSSRNGFPKDGHANRHRYSVRGNTARPREGGVIDRARSDSFNAQNMGVKNQIQNGQLSARKTGKRGGAYADTLINDTIKDIRSDGEFHDKPAFSKNSKAQIKHSRPKGPQIKDVKSSFKSAKDAKGGSKSQGKQALTEAKKSAGNIKAEMKGVGESSVNDRANARDAQFKQQQHQKKKKVDKAVRKTIFAPITLPFKAGVAAGGFGIGSAIFTSLLPILSAFLPILAVGVILFVLGNYFYSETSDGALKDRFFGTDKINYTQYVADKTADVLGNSFEGACEASAFTYYSDYKIMSRYKKREDDKRDISLKIPWYCGVNRGAIDNIWMQEEADNVTLDDNGQLMFRNLEYLPKDADTIGDFYYKSSKQERKNLSGTAANLMPIISMAHYRYDDEWNFDNYQKAEAYCYAMFVHSHDIARFDKNVPKYGPDEENRWKEAFHMSIAEAHSMDRLYDPGVLEGNLTGVVNTTKESKLLKTVRSGDLFTCGTGFSWDADSETLVRPAEKLYNCQNLFIHGMDLTEDTVTERLINVGMNAFETFKRNLLEKAKDYAHKILGGEEDDAGNLAKGGSLGNIFANLKYKDDHDEYKNFDGALGAVKLEPYADGTPRTSVNELDGNDDLEDVHNLKPWVKNYDRGEQIGDEYIACTCPWYCQYGNDTILDGAAEDDTICHLEEHVHEPGCYTCSVPNDHVHDDSCFADILTCTNTDPKHKHDPDACYGKNYDDIVCGIPTADEVPQLTQEDIDNSIVDEEVGPPDTFTFPGPYGDITYTLSCGKEYHKHKPWNSATDPGCWITVAICVGHCGGHINPYVDVVETYTFQGLAAMDPGMERDATFMGASDFTESGVLVFDLASHLANSIEERNRLKTIEEGKTVDKGWDFERYGQVSVEKYESSLKKKGLWDTVLTAFERKKINLGISWKKEWEGRIKNWYSPGPNTPASCVDYIAKSALSAGLDVVDATASIWHGNALGGAAIIKDGMLHILDSSGALQGLRNFSDYAGLGEKDADDFWELYYHFPGWYCYDEDAGELRIDADVMGDMIALYGEAKDDYAAGHEYWEDFDVTLPKAGLGTLSDQQVREVLDAIDKAYPGLFEADPARRLVCEEALREAGCFWYRCDYFSHMNGCYHASGPSECTGFVSGVLSRALDCGATSEIYPRGACGLYNPNTGYFDGNYAGVHCTHYREEGFSLYSSYTSDMVDSYDGTQTALGGWNGNYVRPCGEFKNNTKELGLPGDIVVSSQADEAAGIVDKGQGGHVMIYLGTFADPIKGSGVPSAMVVDCNSSGGSMYWANAKAYTYPGIYRPPVYTIQLDNNDDWKN